MTNVNSASYPTAQVTPKSRFSLIWIIPITAALIGGWLIFKYYSERGTIITITFDAASGIEAKKTPIRFKDVQVGKVKKLSLTPDLKRVKVTVEIYPEMAENLGNNTRFWVERPRVTFQGISGLDTLLSGVHIGIDPGSESAPLENYIGLDSPPIVTTDKKGTRISLNTDSLGSLDIGSPVYYHKINVGEVTSYKLNPQDGSINVFIYIHEPYDLKIKTNTRFWNASGLELNLNASGVSARMESLTSLLIGGISFETPTEELGYELNGETTFKLYDSYTLANDDTQRLNKLFYVMYFDDSLHGLTEDSVIEYAGVKVGKIEDIILEKSVNNSKVKTLVKVSLRIDKFSDKGNKEEAEQILRNLVADGLKAQLVVDSLITGAQYISLDFPTTVSSRTSNKETFTLLSTAHNNASIFPTTLAQTSLLNFDATEISVELTKAIASVTNLINSDDIKKTLEGLSNTSTSIGKITAQLEDEGFSGELVKTLEVAQQTTKDISLLIADTRKTMKSINHVSTGLQKDASQSMKTLNNVSNKLQGDISKTLKNIDRVSFTLDKGLKATLSEDSALQYRLQQLINELSEAAKSFSVLADTIQRKPNSLIIGK
jgi:paraquat-inducible protein B